MSTPINDGGPAFPSYDFNTLQPLPGMSLRDYFAAKALCGLLANPEILKWAQAKAGEPGNGDVPEIITRTAKIYADRMLAARNQTTK